MTSSDKSRRDSANRNERPAFARRGLITICICLIGRYQSESTRPETVRAVVESRRQIKIYQSRHKSRMKSRQFHLIRPLIYPSPAPPSSFRRPRPLSLSSVPPVLHILVFLVRILVRLFVRENPRRKPTYLPADRGSLGMQWLSKCPPARLQSPSRVPFYSPVPRRSISPTPVIPKPVCRLPRRNGRHRRRGETRTAGRKCQCLTEHAGIIRHNGDTLPLDLHSRPSPHGSYSRYRRSLSLRPLCTHFLPS